MKTRRQKIPLIIASSLMLVMILDSKTSIFAAREGLELCLKTVIPSLFPMIYLSSVLMANIDQSGILSFWPVEKFLRLPSGGAGIYLSGLLGGYPIGAKCVADSYQSGAITKKQANHMLQFVNNPGPSFIFGICGLMFSTLRAVWCIWIVQILSSALTGVLLRTQAQPNTMNIQRNGKRNSDSLTDSLRAMAKICAWVILFRILLGFMQQWVLWYFPPTIQVLISGVLELTNGACMLTEVSDESVRYVLCCILLSLGGVCVIMQTKSVIADLSILTHIKGKFLQTLLSALLSIITSSILYPNMYFTHNKIWTVFSGIIIIILFSRKLGIAFFEKMIYNSFRNQKKRCGYAVSKEN